MSDGSKVRWRVIIAAPIAVILIMGGAFASYWALKNAGPPLEKLGVLPAFSFKNQHAQAMGSADLKGKVWVANFIFTRCPTVCPRLSKIMAKVQQRTEALGDRVQLVSFSVDPEYDQPPILAAFAKQFGATKRWSFLTGDVDQVKETVINGLKIGVDRDGDKDNVPNITHGTHFVLMDPALAIRGYYAVEDPAAYEKLLKDVNGLVDGS